MVTRVEDATAQASVPGRRPSLVEERPTDRQVHSDDDPAQHSRLDRHQRNSTGGSQGPSERHNLLPSDSTKVTHRRRDYLASYLPKVPSYYSSLPADQPVLNSATRTSGKTLPLWGPHAVQGERSSEARTRMLDRASEQTDPSSADRTSPEMSYPTPLRPGNKSELLNRKLPSTTSQPALDSKLSTDLHRSTDEPQKDSPSEAKETAIQTKNADIAQPRARDSLFDVQSSTAAVDFGHPEELNDAHNANRLSAASFNVADEEDVPGNDLRFEPSSSVQPRKSDSRSSSVSSGYRRPLGRSKTDARSRRKQGEKQSSITIQPRRSSNDLYAGSSALEPTKSDEKRSSLPKAQPPLPPITEQVGDMPIPPPATADAATTKRPRPASDWSANTEEMMNRFGVKWLERMLVGRRGHSKRTASTTGNASSNADLDALEAQALNTNHKFDTMLAQLDGLLKEALIMARQAEERQPTIQQEQKNDELFFEEPDPRPIKTFRFEESAGERLPTPWAHSIPLPEDPVKKPRRPTVHQIEATQAPGHDKGGLSRRTTRRASLQVGFGSDPFTESPHPSRQSTWHPGSDHAITTGADSPRKRSTAGISSELTRPPPSQLGSRTTEDHVVRGGKPQVDAEAQQRIDKQIRKYKDEADIRESQVVMAVTLQDDKPRAVAMGRDHNGDTTIVYAVPEGVEPPRNASVGADLQRESEDDGVPMGRLDRFGRSESKTRPHLSFTGRRHVSLRGEHHHFNLYRSSKQQPIARDWGMIRKHMVAIMCCLGTALIGLLIGIYAGEVPAIQYQIVDYDHYALQGNVWLYLGMAVSTLIFWPLGLLHGRKPYILLGSLLAIPLTFGQGLILRAFTGAFLGFAGINFKHTLLDIWGASLQSSRPHQEIVKSTDVRRHGGGIGIWLGWWTWSYVGSLSLGFFIGASVIDGATAERGFYVTNIIAAIVLMLSVITPEVRRSPFRRSITEVLHGAKVSTRVARGEIKLHVSQTGPKWWWEEVWAGLILSGRMLLQPGFAIMSIYAGWIYGQVIMIIVLLGALMSKSYGFRAKHTGLSVFAVFLGAMLAIPLTKAGLFSRARKRPTRTDSGTFEKRVSWSSHLVRRTIFMSVLPMAGIAYTIASGGPPTPSIIPILFASLIGFLSCLALAECDGIIMETFDVSDIPPVVARGSSRHTADTSAVKKNKYTCHPRVSAAFAVNQTLGFCFAAATTGVGGAVERNLGAQITTGVVASILVFLTLLLTAILFRWSVVQVVPTVLPDRRLEEEEGDDKVLQDGIIVIGNPSGKTRRLSILELGKMTRWTEIRSRNKLMEVPRYF